MRDEPIAQGTICTKRRTHDTNIHTLMRNRTPVGYAVNALQQIDSHQTQAHE